MDNQLTKENSKLILVLKDHITKKLILIKTKKKEKEIKPIEKEVEVPEEDKENNLKMLNLELKDNKNLELKFPETNQLPYL